MYMIKEMPDNERPRERFLHQGREALSIRELIAIILRTGTKQKSVLDLAQEVACRYPSIRALDEASVRELTRIPGLGEAKAIQLLSALELGKRLMDEPFPSRERLLNPEAVYEHMRLALETKSQETFYALYLDTKGALIEKHKLFIGSLSAALVHPRELFKHAVVLSAASVILVHNHPSGDPTPSESDKRITDTMVKNGRLMDIAVLDHVIIGKGRYHSFKEHGDL